MKMKFTPGDLVQMKPDMLETDLASPDMRDLRGLYGLVVGSEERHLEPYASEEEEPNNVVVHWVVDGERCEFIHFNATQWLNKTHPVVVGRKK